VLRNVLYIVNFVLLITNTFCCCDWTYSELFCMRC